MAITVNWGTKVVSVPKADLTLVTVGPPEERSLDIDWFRKQLVDLLDTEAGAASDFIYDNAAPKAFGDTTLARVVEIINGYTITFEDGQYSVSILGGNSNIQDVTNRNQVSVYSNNSAGAVQVGGDALTKTEFIALKDI